MKVDYHQVNWISFFRERGLVPVKKRQRKKAGAEIVNVVSAFDIETSTIRKPGSDPADTTAYSSFMYVWMFQIEDYLIKGRTWDDWLECLGVIRAALQAYGREKKLAVTPIMVSYIHNASFEFAFISGIYPFTEKDCFFRDERKPLYFRMYNTFEFRCSYMQSNLSLAALTKQCGVKQKLSGQKYDYDKIRYPWTELTPFEDEYTTTDVESLVACMKYRLEKNDDTLHTIPLTSTGYVRRECKESLKNYYLDIMDMKPWRCEEKDGEKVGEIEIYKLLRQSFRGGNTHGNRFLVNKVLPRITDHVDGIYSYDIASSYPTQQLTHKFPMGPFKWIDKPDFKKIAYYIGLGYAVVGTYGFKDIHLKNPKEPMPYISLSRCEAETGFKLDNGRILSAPYIKISCTEIDLEIILDQYTFTGAADVKQAMIAKKDYLFREYRKVILDYYEKKTSLKGDDSEEGLYMYTKSKNMLNAIYGMSATDPIHQTIKYIAGTEEAAEKGSDYKTTSYDTMTAKEVQDALRGAAFPYQWGVY